MEAGHGLPTYLCVLEVGEGPRGANPPSGTVSWFPGLLSPEGQLQQRRVGGQRRRQGPGFPIPLRSQAGAHVGYVVALGVAWAFLRHLLADSAHLWVEGGGRPVRWRVRRRVRQRPAGSSSPNCKPGLWCLPISCRKYSRPPNAD